MKLLIVEDNFLQTQFIKDELNRLLNDVQIETIYTESDFYKFLERINENKPDIILIDIMLRWTDPSAAMTEIPEIVKKEGFHWAGIRCENKLRETSGGKNIPVIMYSVIKKHQYAKFKDNNRTIYFKKDFNMEKLKKMILSFK